MVALACDGHVLIEDARCGKTMLARAIARSIGCTFRRIQFTPDMLPSDVTGVSIFNQKNMEFEFRPGPIMAQIVLADEINRATPKTQSALLEAMEERQVTVDGTTYPMARPSWESWPPRTPSSTKAPFHCPRPRSTASCCAFTWATRARRTRSTS
ncbi:MAG: AAA family ATPase [Caldilineaceae bacterium]